MSIEYGVFVFGATPLMQGFESDIFKQQAGFIKSKLNEFAKDGWRVVSQSTLPQMESDLSYGPGFEREGQQVRTELRIVYTLARDVIGD
jgi:hypothetical protein